ncbi:MAG: hypothetical protein ACFCVF_01685 [Kineosporiaceae bacterium]
MYAVVDSSTLISLAWSGGLDLITRDHCPLDLVIPAEVRRETVDEGLALGYPDAAAIADAISGAADLDPVDAPTVDQAVLITAKGYGLLLTNDVALGRRAANIGVRWLRTGDLVLLCVRTERVTERRATAVLFGLHDAGRLTSALFEDYLKELG